MSIGIAVIEPNDPNDPHDPHDPDDPNGRDATRLEPVIDHLLEWYRDNRRDLPWRRGEPDPYAVWVSEIMLQQTQVASVIPYYERWMARFPNVRVLAAAPLEEVLRVWAGLGYYARARNLHRAARRVVEECGGSVPGDRRLKDLPGIGRYTQGAILSIAFGHAEPIVDANVVRVLCRLFAIEGDPKSAAVQKELWRLAAELVPKETPGDFNQAMMEVGALVCAPSDPACERCPLLTGCTAGSSVDPTVWPQHPPGRPTVRVTHASAVIRSGERYLLTKRPPHGLWGGLWEFPRCVCRPGEPPEECARRAGKEVVGLSIEVGGKVGTVKHAVTHHAITLHAYFAHSDGDPAPLECKEFRWVGRDDLSGLPVSSPQARLIQYLVSGTQSAL